MRFKIKCLAILVFSFLNFSGWTQDFSTEWKSHFAYVDFVDFFVGDESIYVAASNTIFVHNILNRSNRQYTTTEGLSGEKIAAIYYSEGKKLIIVGYQNGLIEIIDEISGRVRSIVDVQNQLGIPSTNIKINDFHEEGDLLYIATGFGIIEYNLSSNLFGDTFFIRNAGTPISDVSSISVFADFIFASIAGKGTFRGNRNNANLIDSSNWNEIQNDVFADIQEFSGNLIAHDADKTIYSYDGTNFVSALTSINTLLDFKVIGNILTVTYSNEVVNLDENFNSIERVSYDVENNIGKTAFLNNEIYFTNDGKGFFSTNNRNFSTPNKLSPAGPELNDIFALDAFDGDLWVTYGQANAFFNDDPEIDGPVSQGVDRLRSGEWMNIPFTSLTTPSITDVSINRNNKEQVFFSGYRGGLNEYNNGEITLYNEQNSNLEKEFGDGFTRVFSGSFDSKGDFWVLNTSTFNLIKKFAKGLDLGVSVDLTTRISERPGSFAAQEITIDSNDNIYIPTVRNGVVGYQISTRRTGNISIEDTGVLFANSKAIAIDLNGDMWYGATTGLRVMNSPERIFNRTKVTGEQIIILQDGVPQELLAGQSITDIKVDGSNNKWIATAGGGVFYVSPDGQETIHNFTKSNSPLPSDIVQDIAVDDSTGAVFFATDNGLLEFKGSVTQASEDLKNLKIFPNPVRPEYINPVVKIQGLTAGANVKITDIEGNLVFEIQNETFGGDGSGLVEWDTRSFSGREVASGVYLVLITGKDQEETAVGKILIVR